MDVLQVKNLTKKFSTNGRNFTAVDNISFSLKEGEILGLLGPNGAGKTTTIDMLLNLTKPSGGEIRVFGYTFNRQRETILKQMNFSAAYVNLPWRLKIIECLYTFARLYEVSDYRKKVEFLLKQFMLEELREKTVQDLSSGQLARLYLCKAFVNDPKLLLLDEPTAYLDPDIADLIRKIILEKVKNAKMTVLFTSHNMSEVTEICDRVIFLNHGSIIAQDTPKSLAKKIKWCRVKLLFEVPLEKVKIVLTNYSYKFWLQQKEIIIEEEEQKLGQLLGRLSLAKLKYSEISVEKPTLEDFFLKVVRKKV